MLGQRIITAVRDASYSQSKTYQVSLCILFLDRLWDPADVPLIQTLAVRLSWRGGHGHGRSDV